MNQAGRTAKKIPPIAGVAAGLAVATAGAWAWRSKGSPATAAVARKPNDKNDEASTSTPTPPAQMQRTGPMVAVYLDNASVEKLHQEYPGTNPGRLRKVVVQYNPSEEERSVYEAHFGGLATVKVTGEASSENRLALMASVSNAGKSVEPQSLACAVDVTPGDVGGGPLGSTVLIEQVKRAGALSKDSWKGPLPALSAHERDFPSEEGSFHKLDEPLALTGSICRADWVEGKTGICRTTTAGGGKREDGWTPQGCIICNTLEASPCRDIYKQFDSLTKRIKELQPPAEKASEDKKTEDSSSPAEDDDRGVAKTSESDDVEKQGREGESRAESDDGVSSDVTASGEGGEQGEKFKESGDGVSKEPETEEEKLRREEVTLLEDQQKSIMLEMFTCSQFHHVFEDSNADDGLVPDMSDEESDGDASSTVEKGSDPKATAAVEGQEAKEDRQQPPADESAQT